jgi:hypothetical protein
MGTLTEISRDADHCGNIPCIVDTDDPSIAANQIQEKLETTQIAVADQNPD